MLGGGSRGSGGTAGAAAAVAYEKRETGTRGNSWKNLRNEGDRKTEREDS